MAMAKSLKCNDCGVLLESVKQAQTHGEVTGHINFGEHTEPITVFICKDCGKKAKTDAEKGLHSRHTGHSNWSEPQALDEVINTEAQMQSAREDMNEDAELLGLKKKKVSSAPTAEGQGQGEASTSGREMVPPAVDENIVKELEGMGFSHNKAVRAVYFSGGGGSEAAVQWLMDHEQDPDIDTPLMVTQASEDAASKLTPEERKKKAQELIKAAKEKREKEEREMSAVRERERIRAGKEMQLAMRKEQEGQMKRNVEAKRREKEADERDRAKLRQKLEDDRRERRRKLGKPEELTEEEKVAEAQKQEKIAAEEKEKSKKKVFGVAKPVSTLDKLRNTLRNMKKTHADDEQKWRTAGTTMLKYIGNIGSNPEEEKFRNIKTSNAAFQQRVAAAAGGVEFFELCGFKKTEDGQALVLPKESLDMDVLNGAAAVLHEMLTNAFFGAL